MKRILFHIKDFIILAATMAGLIALFHLVSKLAH